MTALPQFPDPPTDCRDSWPEIDELLPDAAVDLALGPTWYAAGKVMFDYLVAVLLLPLALPLIGLAALAIRLTTHGPAFYLQTRSGLNGRTYRIVKLRTMQHGCELKSGIRWAGKNDERITRVGRFLRRTHIDELPQLFNVLLGHMSLVGPRPERPEVIKAKGLEQVVPGYSHRLRVKPGVTGLAQVQLPADTDVTSVRHKVVYDLYYARHQGLLLDLRLLLATVVKALGMRPALIRRVFLLPSRERVAKVFRGSLSAEHPALPQLQPV
jgi:lipopolysaccharide/colanic/teichoic acid biosynthesis glycosyltransferase